MPYHVNKIQHLQENWRNIKHNPRRDLVFFIKSYFCYRVLLTYKNYDFIGCQYSNRQAS